METDPVADGPQGDSVIDALPDHVSLTFADDLTAPLPTDQQKGGESTTQIRVFDESCTDAGLLIADPGRADTRECRNYAVGDATVNGPQASVELDNAGAPAGTYTVVWQVVYGDGHPDSQMFTFTAENAVDAAATPTESAPAEPSPEETAPAEPDPTEPDPTETTPAGSDQDASGDQSPADEVPAIADDSGALSTPAVVAIVAGALVLVLIAFIIVMIARARRQ